MILNLKIVYLKDVYSNYRVLSLIKENIQNIQKNIDNNQLTC